MDRLEYINKIADEVIPIFEKITGLKLERPTLILKDINHAYYNGKKKRITMCRWYFTNNSFSSGTHSQRIGDKTRDLLIKQTVIHELTHHWRWAMKDYDHSEEFRVLESEVLRRVGIEIIYAKKNSCIIKSLKRIKEAV